MRRKGVRQMLSGMMIALHDDYRRIWWWSEVQYCSIQPARHATRFHSLAEYEAYPMPRYSTVMLLSHECLGPTTHRSLERLSVHQDYIHTTVILLAPQEECKSRNCIRLSKLIWTRFELGDSMCEFLPMSKWLARCCPCFKQILDRIRTWWMLLAFLASL